MTVTDVEPVVPHGIWIDQGAHNQITLDLNVGYLNTRQTTSIKGEQLWTAKMWISTFEDGSNELYGTVVEEALTEGQQSQDLKKSTDELFRIPGIRYTFDLTDHTCDDARYVCAKFNKGSDPVVEREYLDFHFKAVPTAEVLTGCTEITHCRDPANVLDSSSSWSSSSISSLTEDGYPKGLPCRDNNRRISLHGETYKLSECSFCTCNNSTLSCQFESCQPATCAKPQRFPDACCGVCPYNMTVTYVEPVVPHGIWIDQGAQNQITLDLNVGYLNTRQTTSIKGEMLWTVKMWISTFEDGSNKLYGTVVEEALTEGQQSQDLKKSTDELLRLPGIRYTFDLTDHTCDDARYVCAKFNKGSDPVVEREHLDFHFKAVPTAEVLTGCTQITHCRGNPTSLRGPEIAGLLRIGSKVVRGPDWKWADQDGEPPGLGTVVSKLSEDRRILVQWDSTGYRHRYRMGAKGKYDLNLGDPEQNTSA